VSEPFIVQSHQGPYQVEFATEPFHGINDPGPQRHYIIDATVAALYQKQLACVKTSRSVLLIDAKECNKSLERMSDYVIHLLSRGIKRGHIIVAVGGGIIQDIACFIGAVLLRGVDWHFYPTTLLAQADSCIGSKSSINVGSFKNVVGTYTPPKRILVSGSVLGTLSDTEIRSGIGEMLKVHVIAGPADFDRIAADYERILNDSETLQRYIVRSLGIKRRIIEQDEFDRGIRNVMNLGHSFGHAIESATGFTVPHGIAVTIGIDMAYHLAVLLGRLDRTHFDRMHPVLRRNYRGFEDTEIPEEAFFAAIGKDKKNTDAELGLILPDAEAIPRRVECPNDESFKNACRSYFANVRRS